MFQRKRRVPIKKMIPRFLFWNRLNRQIVEPHFLFGNKLISNVPDLSQDDPLEENLQGNPITNEFPKW